MKANAALLTALLPVVSHAAIIDVVETGLNADAAAIIEPNFGEDALTFSDRTHEHNGAAFDSFTNALSTSGDLIVPLPVYLVGHDYVRFANNARENANYEATVTTDVPSKFYLLLDNRVDGVAGNNSSPNTTDAVLGGSLQWVIDGGWERVNTGISPDGQADYTGVDEGGNGAGGPGSGLNQFYSVWTLPAPAATVTVRNNGIGGNNMISLVAVPDDGAPLPPILSFNVAPTTVRAGDFANLVWRIDPAATAAVIQPGDIDVRALTDAQGAGQLEITPGVTTTYTLTVTTPTGNDTQEATVDVLLLEEFTADFAILAPGESAELSWFVRPDTTVSISPGIGNVDAQTVGGAGSLSVTPTETTTYTIDVAAGGESTLATLTVYADVFAAVDIGATDGQVEPGAGDEFDFPLGAATANTNNVDLLETPWPTKDGGTINISIDSEDQFGFPTGGLDWRDRGEAPLTPLGRLAENFVKNNGGFVRVTVGDLPAGTYDVTSFHIDSNHSQGELILIQVTDALTDLGANPPVRDTGVLADASFPGHPANTGAPFPAGLTPDVVQAKARTFSITANGTDDVVIFFDGFTGNENIPIDTETPLNGLVFVRTDGGPGGGAAIAITDVVRDATLGEVTVTFTSEDGTNYGLFTSSDLATWTEVDDTTATGTSTSFTHSPTAPDLYYRVQQK